MSAPVPYREATVVELLDRVLDKGLILDADLVVTIADVPLVAAKLRVALSSVETMLRHGFMAGPWLTGERAVGAVMAHSARELPA